MKIIEYALCPHKEAFLQQIASYEWRAANYLAALLREDRLHDALGSWGRLYLLVEGNTLVSFVTLSEQDCVCAPDLPAAPWLGFFHTAPPFRGRHYGKILLDHVCNLARAEGYRAVYLATDHIGLYEKYGFRYLENRIDIYGSESRIYTKIL